ncbi:MAG: response regulator [Bacteroidales bacterium]|nr:response regulator [Bacteroidales bacterium]MDE6105566.1 response regulator [Bacteroidales bacterium]MDE6113025.1 response regulator [Bacteroidales bacterium]MDE6307683.1 response regulator [Bacteroidales bacterium]
MTQLILNIENVKILPSLKKILGAIEGVSIAQSKTVKRKSGLDEALADIEAGRIYHAESTDEMFKQILGK